MKIYIKLLFILLAFTACNNDNKASNPLDQLPPATQVGANTFGCLLDGEVFIPGGGTNPLDCVYQFVDGGYYFSLQGNKRDRNNNLITIGLSTNNLEVTQNQTFNLLENTALNAYGTYAFNAVFSRTNSIHTGKLTITKLDTQNQIVSGTFWFDVQDQNGMVHQIREGRFDMQYSQ